MIFTVAAGLLTGILIAVSGIQARENASFEVTRQLQFVTQKIQYAIRDASVVEKVYEGDDEEEPCVNYCSVKLRVEDPTLDPTVISSDIAGVYIQEGAGEKVSLTTANTRISLLTFGKVGNPGGLSTVTVDFAMIYNPDDPELRVERRLASAIAHVSAATFDSDLLPDATESRNIGGSSLKWNNLILSGGVNITGPESVGEQVGFSMIRGTSHGSSSISQYYVSSSPYDKYGQRYDVGGTEMLYLEGDVGQASRRAYFMNGNVGIGTTSPSQKLTVTDGSFLLDNITGLGIRAKRSSDSYENNILYVSNAASDPVLGNSTVISSLGGNAIQLIPNNSTVNGLTVKHSGYVGIGTTSPGTKLDVVYAGSSATGSIRALDSADTDFAALDPNNGLILDRATGYVSNRYVGGGIRFRTSVSSAYDTTAMTIDSSGSVAIGTTSPGSYKLFVEGGNAFFRNDVSAASFTDRTPYPENLGVAYSAVLSMNRLPDGEYDPENKENQLDHSTLTDFVRGNNGDRDLSATVSAQNEVIKDLIRRIEELESKTEK
jgi:hypothetical protein